MPFIKCAQMKNDECKMAVEFVLENEPMNTREVRDFKDNGKNWHLYCGVPDDEPLLYMSKKQVVGQNYLHMVCPWNPNYVGVVESIDGSHIRVKILQTSACSTCEALTPYIPAFILSV